MRDVVDALCYLRIVVNFNFEMFNEDMLYRDLIYLCFYLEKNF